MKVLIHAHTTFSNDGDLPPQQLADIAARRGFDAALVTDHFESMTRDSFCELVQQCRGIATCWMIPGYERSWDGYHMLALGVSEWYDDPDLATWAQRVRAAGGLVVLAHPVRYGHSIPRPILNECDAVEVWNSKFAYDGSIGPDPKAYELLGKERFPLCGQDFHGVRHLTSVAVEVRETCASVRSLMLCLRTGKYRMVNDLFSYGLRPPRFAPILTAVHRIRRRMVKAAIRIRRTAVSYALWRPHPRPKDQTDSPGWN